MTHIALVLLFLLPACYTSYDWQAAKESAEAFSAKMPGATGQVECAHVDSDGDGYCSCTAFMEKEAPRQLDCGCPSKREGAGCMHELATGCKPYNPLKAIQLLAAK